MQHSSQSKAAAERTVSSIPAGDETFTPASAAKSGGKMMTHSMAKSVRNSQVSAADNKTEASLDGDQRGNSSVADFVPETLASKETSSLRDDRPIPDEVSQRSSPKASGKRKLSEITGGHGEEPVASKRLKLSEDPKGAKKTEEPAEDAKPASETTGSEKVEADDGAKPEKSALPTEAMAEGTANSGDSQPELAVEAAPAEESKAEPEVV